MASLSFVCMLLLAGLSAAESDEAKPNEVRVAHGHVASYPRVIRGQITDADGNPVAGALVEWAPIYPEKAARESTTTTADGSYQLKVLKAGRFYKLGISAMGFCPTWHRHIIPGPESAPTVADFKLQPETTIELTIAGKSGEIIRGLEVTPRTPQTGFNSSFSMVQQPELIPGHDKPTACDEDGVCRLKQLLPAPPVLENKADGDTDAMVKYKERQKDEGWMSLLIQKKGKWVHEHQVSRKEYFESNGKLRIELPDYRNPILEQNHKATIYGKVVNPTGEPVTKYQFTVRHRAEPFAVDDPEGRFEWGKSLDPDRSYEIRIFAEGFAPYAQSISPKLTSRAEPRRLQLMPAPSTIFQLVDAITEKPIEGAPVVSGVSTRNRGDYIEWNDLKNYADGHHSLDTVLHLISDTDGRIAVPEGAVLPTLIIQSAGYGRKIMTPQQRPEPDADGIIRLALEPAATIYATRAADSHIARQGDNIYLNVQAQDNFSQMFHSLRLDASGECFIDSLAPGKYSVGLMHSGGFGSTACWLKTVELKAGQNVELALGEMTGAIMVSGRTSPFTDVSLGLKADLPGVEGNLSGISVIATISDIDGYFELNGLHADKYIVEHGRLNSIGRGMQSFLASALKGPKEIYLQADTHIDYIAGTVEPPESAVEAPKATN
ncbi:MAG: carboxypeptidase-like regulatory domain-containing protein [Planctomycetota bacterium]|nr:carboxypeptidase-like regulatory domain-containing protein [Planctomycetota bacterium]